MRWCAGAGVLALEIVCCTGSALFMRPPPSRCYYVICCCYFVFYAPPPSGGQVSTIELSSFMPSAQRSRSEGNHVTVLPPHGVKPRGPPGYGKDRGCPRDPRQNRPRNPGTKRHPAAARDPHCDGEVQVMDLVVASGEGLRVLAWVATFTVHPTVCRHLHRNLWIKIVCSVAFHVLRDKFSRMLRLVIWLWAPRVRSMPRRGSFFRLFC